MGIDLMTSVRSLVPLVIFVALGLALFGAVFWLVAASLPFSLRKQLASVQNISVAVVLAAVILGLAIVVSAVTQG
jgi:hypothetical protein